MGKEALPILCFFDGKRLRVVARCCMCNCRVHAAEIKHKPRGRNHKVLISGAGSILAGVIDYATNHRAGKRLKELEATTVDPN